MEIKQLKAYRFTSIATAMICALAFQDLYRNKAILNITFVAAALGSLLLGIAAIAVILRYSFNLLSQFKTIGVINFFSGMFLLFSSVSIWFIALVKFAVVPLTNETIQFETQYPAMVGLINGISGIMYFYFIWPLQLKCLTSHDS